MPPQKQRLRFSTFSLYFLLFDFSLFVLKLTVGFKAIKSCMHWFNVLMKWMQIKLIGNRHDNRRTNDMLSFSKIVVSRKLEEKNSTSRRECGIRFQLKKEEDKHDSHH